MSSKFWAELSSDYEKLFETELGYDVIIYAGDELNIKEIHAHSSILCIRSQYFRSAFSNEWAEKKDGKFILRKPNISPHLFNIILRFIYCGNIELKNLQGPEVLKLLIAVDELNIQQLITYIQEYLIEHQTEFLYQNPTDKFIDLKAPLLEMLIKRDDLNMEEIKIWEGLLKWCFYQQNVINDPTKWSKEDIIKIERSLQRDGFNASSFHRNCDNKGATIWIAKIQGTKQLVGGYNPLDWCGSNIWKNTTDSFLFYLKDEKDISNAKLSYVNNANYAIYCHDTQGPHMGDFLCSGANNWYFYSINVGIIYPKIDIPENFMVENYEVFQVIKK
ncbi:BTB/POZ protein [Rhizophagus irregularis DAOM 181602=DAOM 197198]|nr:BTB/POZ protein [Rhizophagus irregularis DAOM 181602=DAOM 197198]